MEHSKKKSRKIRCTQEFNQPNETSLVTSSSKSKAGKNVVTKKSKHLPYLPKIDFNVDPIKENCSPNVTHKDMTKKSKKKSRSFTEETIESGDQKVGSTNNGTSTEEDHRDSEIEFKKKKKRRKQKKQTKSSSDDISENEAQIEINKKSTTKGAPRKSTSIHVSHVNVENHAEHIGTPQDEKLFEHEDSKENKKKARNSVLKTRKSATSYSKSINLEASTRKTRNSISKGHNTFSESESSSSTSQSVECKRKTRTPVLKASHQSNIHTSESLAMTSVSSEEISDDVFGENIGLSDTLALELSPNDKCKYSQENSKGMFVSDLQGDNIFELHVVNESLHVMNTNGKRSVRFTSQPRRSKSLDGSINMSNRKSTTFMTPRKNNSIQMESPRKSQIKDTKSLNTTNKSSVSFASVDSRRSKSYGKENSKIFPKSPYVSRITRSNKSGRVTSDYNNRKSISLNEIDFLQDESSPKITQKYSNLRKPTGSCLEMSGKKSVSFFTPVNNNKNKPKTSFKKSPYVHRSTIDLSISNTDNSLNETFPLTLPTIELETLKNNSIISSSAPKLLEGSNATFSSKKSIINLVTPSPEVETKSTSNCSSLSTFDDINRTVGSSECSKSDVDMKVTKRKHWNRSLGVSIMDTAGLLHNVSSPWGKEAFNDFQSTYEHNSSRDSFISPIKKSGSSKKIMSPIKIQENSLSTTQPETVISETLSRTFSPLKKEKSPKKLLQDKPSRQENKVAVKRTKLPNFALIHQRAYDKLENVKEMSLRKAARAQQLLTGKKPGPETNMKIPTPNLKIKSPKSRKLLRYSPKKRHSGENSNVAEPSTSSMSVIKTHTKITPSKSNSKKILKPGVKKIAKSNIPKPVSKKPLSKLGFKIETSVKDKKVLNRDQLVAAANKTKPSKNALDARRNVIQNVRTNRRFELLMKMRQKD